MNRLTAATATIVSLCAHPALAKDLTLAEVLDRAVQAAPAVEARREQAEAASAGVGLARASLLPTVEAQAIDALGFPGSTGYLGVGGIMGSPYRSGLAGGLVATQQVYDFGRADAAEDAARQETESRRQLTRLEADRVRIEALKLYVHCSRLRSLEQIHKELADAAATVGGEVKRFVRTGQRSVVDRYLVDEQVEQARTEQAVAGARYGEAVKRLALALGAPPADTGCPLLGDGPAWTPGAASADSNPYVQAAVAALSADRARLDAVHARYMPKINVLGSVGWMQKVRLVKEQDYALGIGVSVPLFDGFKEDYEIRQDAALVASRQFEVSSRKIEVAQTFAQYDEQIAAASTRFTHLVGEEKVAKEAFTVATKRYLAAEGTLTDLRDSLRDLARVEVALNEAQAERVEAMGAKALMSGSRPESGP